MKSCKLWRRKIVLFFVSVCQFVSPFCFSSSCWLTTKSSFNFSQFHSANRLLNVIMMEQFFHISSSFSHQAKWLHSSSAKNFLNTKFYTLLRNLSSTFPTSKRPINFAYIHKFEISSNSVSHLKSEARALELRKMWWWSQQSSKIHKAELRNKRRN